MFFVFVMCAVVMSQPFSLPPGASEQTFSGEPVSSPGAVSVRSHGEAGGFSCPLVGELALD